MLARLAHVFLHLFTPRHTNNHRPKLLYPQSLAVLTGLILVVNSSIRVFAQVTGGVLGYASDISVEQVLEQTNRRRIEQGLRPLAYNGRLADAARRKAADMFTSDYWAHTNPQTGTEPWFFFDAVGYRYRYAGENLARDFSATDPMVQAWMDSSTHRDNLLSSRYLDTGIAAVNGTLGGVETTLVVQLFGATATAVAAPQVSAADDQGGSARLEGVSRGVQGTEKAGSQNAPFQATPAEPVVYQEAQSAPTLTADALGDQGSGVSSQAFFSPFDVSKAVAMATLSLVGAVIVVDSVVVWRRRTYRLAGRNWAHLMFVAGLMLAIGTLSPGAIQ